MEHHLQTSTAAVLPLKTCNSTRLRTLLVFRRKEQAHNRTDMVHHRQVLAVMEVSVVHRA
jgi:hypothetical protein